MPSNERNGMAWHGMAWHGMPPPAPLGPAPLLPGSHRNANLISRKEKKIGKTRRATACSMGMTGFTGVSSMNTLRSKQHQTRRESKCRHVMGCEAWARRTRCAMEMDECMQQAMRRAAGLGMRCIGTWNQLHASAQCGTQGPKSVLFQDTPKKRPVPVSHPCSSIWS